MTLWLGSRRLILLLYLAMIFLLLSCENNERVTSDQVQIQSRPYYLSAGGTDSFNYAYIGAQVTVDIGAFIEPGLYAEPIYAYRFTLNYDPGFLDFTGAEKGPCLTAAAGSTTFMANLQGGVQGAVIVEEASDSGDGYAGACMLSKVTFTIKKYGQTLLSYSDVSLTDPAGEGLYVTGNDQIINLYGSF